MPNGGEGKSVACRARPLAAGFQSEEVLCLFVQLKK